MTGAFSPVAAVSPAPDALPADHGTYALGLCLSEKTRCRIGALGIHEFPAGLYLYVGSAWGSGGLRARVGHHLRGSASPRWHLDYLRPHARPVVLWLALGSHLECEWARYLVCHPDAEVIAPRFGASDCRCPAHLFRLTSGPRSFVQLEPALALPGAPQFLVLDVTQS